MWLQRGIDNKWQQCSAHVSIVLAAQHINAHRWQQCNAHVSIVLAAQHIDAHRWQQCNAHVSSLLSITFSAHDLACVGGDAKKQVPNAGAATATCIEDRPARDMHCSVHIAIASRAH